MIGIRLRDTTIDQTDKVEVVSAGYSIVFASDLTKGEFILQVNGHDVSGASAATAAIIETSGTLTLTVQPRSISNALKVRKLSGGRELSRCSASGGSSKGSKSARVAGHSFATTAADSAHESKEGISSQAMDGPREDQAETIASGGEPQQQLLPSSISADPTDGDGNAKPLTDSQHRDGEIPPAGPSDAPLPQDLPA